jgi:hypothetical protein
LAARAQRLVDANHLSNVDVIASAVDASHRLQAMVSSTEPNLNHMATVSVRGAGPPEAMSEVMTFASLLHRSGVDRVQFVRVGVKGAAPDVLAGLLDAIRAGLPPPTVMFGYGPSHWARAGHFSADVVVLLYTAGYQLLAIDYEAGGLKQIESLAETRHGGNVLAVHSDQIPNVLTRVQWVS